MRNPVITSSALFRLGVFVSFFFVVLPNDARPQAKQESEPTAVQPPLRVIDNPPTPSRANSSVQDSFLVTGKLFGYFRLPDQQRRTNGFDLQNPCPSSDKMASGDEQMSRDAKIFDGIREKHASAILLGTGDNLAPNYYSRVIVQNPGSPNLHKEEEEWEPGTGWVRYENVSKALAGQLRDGQGTVPTDNVACFLSYEGYTAIVPGKHDFFYGPERLRQLARFLAGIPASYTHYRPVQTLAANLVIRTTWAKDHKPVADSMKHASLPFDTQWGKSDSRQKVEIVEDFTDGGFTYPSLRRVTVKFTGWTKNDADQVKVFLCASTKPGDPDKLALPPGNCGAPLVQFHKPTEADQSAGRTPTDTTVFPPTVSNENKIEYTFARSTTLQPNENYGICIENPDSPRPGPGPWFYCFRFSVFTPFFQFREPSPAPKGSRLQFENPQEYAMVTHNDDRQVAIFGVMDPDLTTSIGTLNYAWKNVQLKNVGTKNEDEAEYKYKTAMAIGNPVTALKALQQKFAEKNPDFHGLRILLAHMTPAKAALLAAKLTDDLRFDIVVSAADDEAATPNGTVVTRTTLLSTSGTPPYAAPCQSITPTPCSKVPPPGFVFVPPTHETPRKHLARRWVNLRELSVTTDHDLQWSFTIGGDPAQVELPVFDQDPSGVFWLSVCNQLYAGQAQHTCNQLGAEVVDRAPNQNPREWDENIESDALQQLVLSSLQKKQGADVAMLQQRDFYLQGLEEFFIDHCEEASGKCVAPQFTGPSFPIQEVLDRIIWKGDFIYPLSVQGSTLKTVLDESKAFSKLEKSPTGSVDERGRALVTAGVHKDEGHDEYRINDAPLDPARLYTVATSDYIALGDTGYPELATPPVGDPADPISSEKSLVRIAAALCQSFFNSGNSPNCDPRVHDYFDELADLLPNDNRNGDTQRHKLYSWMLFRSRLGQPSDWERDKNYDKQDLPSDIDKRIQDRTIGVISVDKLAIGFDGLTHNLTESALKSDFGGIPNAQVTAKHFHSWDTDIESSAKRFGKSRDLFVSETLQYSAKFTSQATPPRDINQTTNLIQIDFGAYLHSHEKSLPRFQWLIGGHFETQPFRPFSTVTINPVGAITSAESLIFNPNRSRLTLGRTGPRWQNRKSFFELGGEAGANFHAIHQFDVKASSTGPVVLPCPLDARQTLNKCVNNFNMANPTTPIDGTFFVQTENETRRRFGIYWNSSLIIPLDPRVTIQVDNQGDYFFPVSHDNSTDTRFRHQYTQAIKFYVFPNLDFEPTYKIFLFENKVQNHFLFQQELAVKINLAFDLWNWRQRSEELRYQKPSSKQ